MEDGAAATNAANDPAHAWAATATTRSVIYTWTAPADGMVHADTFGSTYDTVLSAYTGACGALVPLACSDDAEEHGFASEIALAVTTGTTITFMVSDGLGTNDPTLFFHLDFSTPPPPHDGCSAAKVVAATPYGDASNTYGASVAPGDPAPPCGGLSSGKSVWYEYTPPADGKHGNQE